jgi:hypothetical protein
MFALMRQMMDVVMVMMTGRDGRWPALSRRWLAAHPCCAACGTKRGCVPHHIIPVSWDAAHELDETNLITLCGPHHLWIGHLGDFKSFNASVVADAALWIGKITARPYRPKEQP